jgi:hypothetical protein
MTIVGLDMIETVIFLPLGMTAKIALMSLGVVAGLLGVAMFLAGAIDG